MREKIEGAPQRGEHILLHGQEGRFYVMHRLSMGSLPKVVCVDKDGYPVAEMFSNMSGGVTFTTHIPLGDIDLVKMFTTLKAEVKK